MKRTILFLSAAFIFSQQYAHAQSTEKIPCPAIALNGPASYTVEEGDSLIFKVNPFAKAYEKWDLTYNWAISNGSIGSGQGTNRIAINTAGLKGQSITASVELGGMGACPNISSYSVDVIEKVVKPKAKTLTKTKAASKGKTSVKRT